MKKLARLLPVVLVSSFCLAGCTMKTTKEKFTDKAIDAPVHSFKKASAAVDYKITSNGTTQSAKGTVHYTYDSSSSSYNKWYITEEDSKNSDLYVAYSISEDFVGMHVLDFVEAIDYAVDSDDYSKTSVSYYTGMLIGPAYKITMNSRNMETDTISKSTLQFEKHGLISSLNVKYSGSQSGYMKISFKYSR